MSPAGLFSLRPPSELGREAFRERSTVFPQAAGEISPDDAAILYLTSGATGEPKMGVTSHARNPGEPRHGADCPAAHAGGFDGRFSAFGAHRSTHRARTGADAHGNCRSGSRKALRGCPSELKTIRPTFFLAPPRVWERMYATIQTEIKKKRPALRAKIFDGAARVGNGSGPHTAVGQSPFRSWMARFVESRPTRWSSLKFESAWAAESEWRLPAPRRSAKTGRVLRRDRHASHRRLRADRRRRICFNPLDRPKPGSIGQMLPGVEAAAGRRRRVAD